jgi:hypothetical protein
MERSGYRDYEAPLTLPVNEPTAYHAATLEPRTTTVASADHPSSSTLGRGGRSTTQRGGSERGGDHESHAGGSASGGSGGAQASEGSEASGSSGQGVLRINTRPWSQVFVDGRLIGNTPQMNIQLPAGRHTVTLVNSDFNIRQTITVDIRPGQTETRVLTLQPGG